MTTTIIARLAPGQLSAAGASLARAFFEDPSWVWAVPDDAKRRQVLAWFFPAAARYGLLYGEVYTDGQAAGAAIWLPPGRTALRASGLMRVGLLLLPLKAGLSAFSRFVTMGRVLDERHRQDVPPEHWYLWLLGVDPPRQGQGLGSALVQPILSRADSDGVSCYLDTTLERNLTFYQRHGFEIVFAGTFPKGGPRFWTLRREPRR